MIYYALSQGLSIPPTLADLLDSCRRHYTAEPAPALENLKDRALVPVEAGLNPSSPQPAPPILHDLVALHSQLARTIEPVKPHAAVMMVAHTNGRTWFKFLGPVPLVRQMMLISVLSLIGMFGISLSDTLSADPRHFSLLTNHGLSLLINELFLLFAASIGASFNALFIADGYARGGAWEPAYETSYWIRYVLGVLSGAMLATLIPIEEVDPASKTGSFQGFGGPVLALIGGFSSNVVYRILARLSETLETMVSGGMKEKLAAQEKAAGLRAAERLWRERMAILSMMARLNTQLGENGDPRLLREEFERIQREILGSGSLGGLPEAPRAGRDG